MGFISFFHFFFFLPVTIAARARRRPVNAKILILSVQYFGLKRNIGSCACDWVVMTGCFSSSRMYELDDESEWASSW